MELSKNIITLSDKRSLGYQEYGYLNGFPIIAFHGLPGSRLWFDDNDETSNLLGIRLITVDRPGFGNSDQNKKRTFLSFSDDVQELIGYLGLEKVSVFGISGGGVYAAAFAYKYPELTFKCGLVSSVNQFENGKPPKEMAFENKTVFTLSKRFPWLMKFLLNQQRKMIQNQPERYINSIMLNTKHLCEADKVIMENRANAEFLIKHIGEAFKKGVEGVVSEAKLFTKPWGFDAKNIQVAVELWHGTEDTLSPIAPIKKLCNEIPNCSKIFIDGKGHFLTEYPEIWEGILTSLKQ